ncbi:hypothetical protein ACJZ2D_013615 [Fusarium nematophilum]
MQKSALLGLLASSPVSAQLHSLAQAAGLKYFGTAVDNGYLSDAAYKALADDASEFGQVVPENGQKWDSTEPSRGSFSYEKADVVPDLAKKNGQVLRCHALTWHSQLPSWVSGGSFSAEELQSIIEAHIANVVGHYKGDCYAWDVVNEAIGDDGNWRDSVFYQTLGTDYLAISFNAAKKADPAAKLYYNDYNLEANGAKTDRAVELVKLVQDTGAPIDGVGFQGHLIVGSTPSRSELVTVLERFTALDVEVAYTEVDIRHSSVPASEAALKTQGDDYANVVGSCLDVEGCVGVTIWGISDKYSWVPDTVSGPQTTLQTQVTAVTEAESVSVPQTTLRTISVTPFLNSSVPQTTFQTRTTAAAPIASEVDEEEEGEEEEDDCEEDDQPIPTYNIPGNSSHVQSTQVPVYEPIETAAPIDEAIPTTRVPIIRHSSSAFNYPWNNSTATAPAGTAPAIPTGTGTVEVKHWYQCGGRNWEGPTKCEEPYVCVEWNEWYFQCVEA